MLMKTAISIPDELFAAAERVARHLGLSRSQLYRHALAAYLESVDDSAVTAALDHVHGSRETSRLDPVLANLQLVSLSREEW